MRASIIRLQIEFLLIYGAFDTEWDEMKKIYSYVTQIENQI